LKKPNDPDLPATMKFILFLGAFITVGWAAMFVLLRSRW
jgi:hypothetical protein